MKKKLYQILLMLAFLPVGLIAQEESFYSVQMLPFCTPDYNEFSPIFYGDGIVFCSNRKTDLFITYQTYKDVPLLDLFFAEQIDRNRWEKPVLFSKDLRTNFNEGPAAFNNDETEIYFTRNNEITKKIGNSNNRKNKLGIYVARKSNGDWEDIQPFEYDSPDFNYGHPSVSPDGKRLFFASDKDGGYGGVDLYVCYMKAGVWGEPENVGPVINTSGDEKFPFIHANGKLFFSSTGHNSMGRLDIFSSELVDGKWKEPYHFKEPINSKLDDFGMIMDSFEKSGFFSSNRSHSDDIYSFTSVFPIFENTKKMEKNDYCFVFYETSKYDLDTMNMLYEWDLGDGTKVRGLEAKHCFNGPGNYNIKLNIIDKLTGDVYFNEATYDFAVENIEQVYIESPDTCLLNEKVQFNGLKTNLKDFKISEYFWSFSDGWKSKGPEVDHVFQSPGSYIVQLGVSGKSGNKDKEEKYCVYKSIVVVGKMRNKKLETEEEGNNQIE